MAVDVSSRGAILADRKRSIAQTKARNQKLVLGGLGAVLLVVLALELPSTLGKLSGGSSGTTPPTAEPLPATRPALVMPAKSAARLTPMRGFVTKNPFIPQVGSPDTQLGGAPGTATSTGSVAAHPPTVRTKDFVAKDPFVQQLAAPAAASPLAAPAAATTKSATPLSPVGAASGYVVVVASVPAAHGQDAAASALVAAENAGLPDVKVSLIHSALDVYIGPYANQELAQQGLIRALRVGYTIASVEPLPRSRPSL
jgi:hypothetical protein